MVAPVLISPELRRSAACFYHSAPFQVIADTPPHLPERSAAVTIALFFRRDATMAICPRRCGRPAAPAVSFSLLIGAVLAGETVFLNLGGLVQVKLYLAAKKSGSLSSSELGSITPVDSLVGER